MESVGSSGSEAGSDLGSGPVGAGELARDFEQASGAAPASNECEARPVPPTDLAEGSGQGATAALIEVAIGLQDIAAKQDQLRELFESRLRSDEVQAKAQERLHDQLREYKANFVRQEMQPLLRDLIYCYDYAADESERAGHEGPPPTASETAHAFDHLKQMVADVLAKYDVEPYRSTGPVFDRREQQCVRTVPTAIEADEKKIAVVGAIGFRLADQIVRKEQVTVYKFTAAMTSASQGTTPAADRS